MKIVTPSVELMRTGLETEMILPEPFIEKVGRTCYKSEDKITEDSAAKFVSNLIKRGHEAMIEHWSMIFKTDEVWYHQILSDWNELLTNINLPNKTRKRLRAFIRFTKQADLKGRMRYVLSGNMRAWRDYTKAYLEAHGFLPQYLYGMIRCKPIFFPEYQDWVPGAIVNNILMPIDVTDLYGEDEIRVHTDVTVKFVCDRGVSHEIVRHRVASFAQESTRYCNYGLEKFGNEITVVRPSWCGYGSDLYKRWFEGCELAESAYFALLDEGAAPQEARSVLPNSTKTEIIVTMNLDGWQHFFELRCPSNAQPDMREVANMAYCLFEKHIYNKFGI